MTSNLYTSADLATWTQNAWDQLAGCTLTVRVRGTIWDNDRLLDRAQLGTDRTVHLLWSPEGGLTVNTDDIEITVHAGVRP